MTLHDAEEATATVKHTPAESWGFYYIPRSPLNPHGTYAIVSREDLGIDKSGRHHIAEISGFGGGSPNARKVPDAVRLIAAAPDMLVALIEIAKGEGRFSRDPYEHACNVIEDMKQLASDAIAKAEGRAS